MICRRRRRACYINCVWLCSDGCWNDCVGCSAAEIALPAFSGSSAVARQLAAPFGKAVSVVVPVQPAVCGKTRTSGNGSCTSCTPSPATRTVAWFC